MGKLALRRVWFQVHRWIGLLLAALLVAVALSGTALVWQGALDRAINPRRYAVSGGAMLGADAYVAAAHRVLGQGRRVSVLTLPGPSHGPVTVAAASAGPTLHTVYLDPPTARVLYVAVSDSGSVDFLRVLHGSLQAPVVGRAIVGWIGVATMILCLTGIRLWWPTTGRAARGWRWRRHRDAATSLHYVLGIWVAVPLLVLSLTGAWIAFPRLATALAGGADGHSPFTTSRGRPLDRPALTLDTVLAAAAASDGHGPWRSVEWPTERSPDWTVTYGDGEGVKVADDTRTALAVPARRPPVTTRLMRRLHDGSGMGPVWQAVVFASGLLATALATTGVLMWWRGRRRPVR